MFNGGDARRADRERVERVASATGQSVGEVYGTLDEQAPLKSIEPIKEWKPNSGQHYPDFVDREEKKIEVKSVRVAKPQRVVRGKRLSDEAYAAEMDAQRKRAEALAYLAQTDDGIPDDCLRGAAAEKRRREKRPRITDNTLELVGNRTADDTYKQLQAKLLSVQAQLRDNGGALAALRASEGAPVPQVAGPPPPPGWRVEVHPASKQVLYVNETTGEKRGTRPSSGGPALPTPPPVMPPRAAVAVPGGHQTKNRRGPIVDPLDPTGGKGRWSDGVHHMGERMADSTATGPLWQQRPLPAPSKVLRMTGPGVREGSSIGPALPGPARNRQPPVQRPTGGGPPQKSNAFVPRQARR